MSNDAVLVVERVFRSSCPVAAVNVSRSAWSIRRAVNALSYREGRCALRRLVLPALEHQAILTAIQPTVVIDVGANRGQFALDVKRATPAARVVSFEPLPHEADIYEEIFDSSSTHQLVRKALAASSGRALMHVSGAPDSSSLLPIGAGQREAFPGTAEVAEVDVDAVTLDGTAADLGLDARSLLKLDVQGAELDVLRGGDDTLQRFRWIYLEMSFVELYEGQPLATDLIAHLRSRGFELIGTGRPTRVGGLPIQVDGLFARTG